MNKWYNKIQQEWQWNCIQKKHEFWRSNTWVVSHQLGSMSHLTNKKTRKETKKKQRNKQNKKTKKHTKKQNHKIKTNKQTNKQTNQPTKQTNKQASERASKQANKTHNSNETKQKDKKTNEQPKKRTKKQGKKQRNKETKKQRNKERQTERKKEKKQDNKKTRKERNKQTKKETKQRKKPNDGQKQSKTNNSQVRKNPINCCLAVSTWLASARLTTSDQSHKSRKCCLHPAVTMLAFFESMLDEPWTIISNGIKWCKVVASCNLALDLAELFSPSKFQCFFLIPSPLGKNAAQDATCRICAVSLALLLCSRRDRMAACNTLMSPEGRVSAMMTVRKAGMSLVETGQNGEQQKPVPVAMPLSRKSPLIWRIKFMLLTKALHKLSQNFHSWLWCMASLRPFVEEPYATKRLRGWSPMQRWYVSVPSCYGAIHQHRILNTAHKNNTKANSKVEVALSNKTYWVQKAKIWDQ